MKKFFFFAAAALAALASCTKVTPVEQPDQLITFETVKYANATKADGQSLPKDQHNPKHFTLTQDFGVYAIMTNDKTWANASDPLVFHMNNVQVAADGTPSGNYYWPKKGLLSFVAYSPYDAVTPTVTKTNNVQFDYTIAEDADVDLMVSDITTDLTAADVREQGDANHFKAGVPILFTHALTKLVFQFQEGAYPTEFTTGTTEKPSVVDPSKSTIEITEFKLLSFENKKSFTGIGSTTAPWATPTAGAGSADYERTAPGTIARVALSTPETVTPCDSVMIMPQTIYASTATQYQALYIKYNIKTHYNQNGGVDVTETDIEATVPFYDTMKLGTATTFTNEFKKNMKVVYTITINPFADETIVFDPAVVDWDSNYTGTITIE